jgi:hypothetical protein
MIRERLDWSTVDDRIKGYLTAALKFLEKAGAKPAELQLEKKLVHPGLFYAGRADVIGVMFGEEAVVDWKSGALGHAGIQLAAYEWAERYGSGNPKPKARIAVQLREDGTYTMTRYTKADDYLDWQACCRLYNRYHLHKERE